MTTDTATNIRIRENRVRRAAKRRGLEANKANRRDPNGTGWNRWVITTPGPEWDVVAGGIGQRGYARYTLTLAEVEAYLGLTPGGDTDQVAAKPLAADVRAMVERRVYELGYEIWGPSRAKLALNERQWQVRDKQGNILLGEDPAASWSDIREWLAR